MTRAAETPETLIAATRGKPLAFNKYILGRVHPSVPDGYTRKQVEICDSVKRFRRTLVQSAHGTGKTHLAAGLALHYLYTHPDSTVLLVSPSYQQLKTVLWAEVRKSFANAVVPLPGRIIQSPMRLEVAEKWHLLGFSADTSPEKLSGHHGEHVFVILDESSDERYDNGALDALIGLNAAAYLYLGNPTRHGTFKTLCDQADGETSNRIVLSAWDSPHAEMPRSPVGLADKGYIEDVRSSYGESSPVWRIRVEGLFADTDDFTLIPNSWLERCRTPAADPTADHGPVWIAADLSAGTGQGDWCVVVVRDNDRVIAWDHSKTWDFPAGVAERVANFAKIHNVPPSRVVYDSGGLGMGFSYALKMAGLPSCRGYVGAASGSGKATNLRGECAVAFRDRLDPSKHPTPFHVPAAFLDLIRPEVSELRFELAGKELIKLERKDDMKRRLRGASPDHLDCLFQSYAFERKIIQVF